MDCSLTISTSIRSCVVKFKVRIDKLIYSIVGNNSNFVTCNVRILRCNKCKTARDCACEPGKVKYIKRYNGWFSIGPIKNETEDTAFACEFGIISPASGASWSAPIDGQLCKTVFDYAKATREKFITWDKVEDYFTTMENQTGLMSAFGKSIDDYKRQYHFPSSPLHFRAVIEDEMQFALQELIDAFHPFFLGIKLLAENMESPKQTIKGPM